MEIRCITADNRMWDEVRNYAENCSWRAGKALADVMARKGFEDWERVVAATEGESICGYCTVAKTDCLPDAPYTPYICYVFVGEEHRGKRISEKMIRFAMEYLKNIGFDRVHLVSDHDGLYEKYGFRVIDRRLAPWGEIEKVYMQELK